MTYKMRLDELKQRWNAQADQYNQWDNLSLDEIVMFAQDVERHECEIAVWLVRQEATKPDAHDEGINGWLQEAENRIRMRSNVELTGAEGSPRGMMDYATGGRNGRSL